MDFETSHIRNVGVLLRRQLVKQAVGTGGDRVSGGFMTPLSDLPGRPGSAVISDNPDRIPTNFRVEHDVIHVEQGYICILKWFLLDEQGTFPLIPDEFNKRTNRRVAKGDKPHVFDDHEEAQKCGDAAHAVLRAWFVQWANTL